ncbi:MAG: hypothetical protein KL787_01935 [Taibaiella sp.]|nr:hypothetical protein [Taibaiella sp.]
MRSKQIFRVIRARQVLIMPLLSPQESPPFFLIGHSWDYGSYTWHTQIDTYDKIVFEDVRKNAETIAIMVYLACEEPEMFSRRKSTIAC